MPIFRFFGVEVDSDLTTQARRNWGSDGVLAPPVSGQTVNPNSTRGTDYTHHSNPSPPDFQTMRRPCYIVRPE